MTDPTATQDTIPMSREDIERAFDDHRRKTLPLGVQVAIADAQQLDMRACPACGCGMIPSDVAARVALAIGDDFDEEAPITAVEDVTTQPVGRK